MTGAINKGTRTRARMRTRTWMRTRIRTRTWTRTTTTTTTTTTTKTTTTTTTTTITTTLVCLCKPVCMCVCVCVCAYENQPWAIMKVTYARGWTSPLCDVELSCPQKRPYSYLEHTRRRDNVRDVLSLQHLPYYWLICSCHVWFTRRVKAVDWMYSVTWPIT